MAVVVAVRVVVVVVVVVVVSVVVVVVCFVSDVFVVEWIVVPCVVSVLSALCAHAVCEPSNKEKKACLPLQRAPSPARPRAAQERGRPRGCKQTTLKKL